MIGMVSKDILRSKDAMTQPLEKACTLCGVDLNGQKRVKNASGEYFCPPCWKSHNSVFGESTAVSDQPTPSPAAMPPPKAARMPTSVSAVRVTRSELEPTMAKAVLQGVKAGVATGLFRGLCKAIILIQFIVVLGLAKKIFPEANGGIMIILTLTSVIAGVVEVEFLARAMKFKAVWVDMETLKSRVGIMVMIGFGLAYAFAIFLAVAGG